MSVAMSSNRPYLLRAFYEWIVDNNCTPHLVVNAEYPGTVVPTQFVQNGQIVLNVSPTATGNLLMGDELVTFNARFGGQPMQLSIPYPAVLGIYARENGAGTIFEDPIEEPTDHTDTPDEVSLQAVTEDVTQGETAKPQTDEAAEKPRKGSHLKVVK